MGTDDGFGESLHAPHVFDTAQGRAEYEANLQQKRINDELLAHARVDQMLYGSSAENQIDEIEEDPVGQALSRGHSGHPFIQFMMVINVDYLDANLVYDVLAGDENAQTEEFVEVFVTTSGAIGQQALSAHLIQKGIPEGSHVIIRMY